MKPRKKSSSPSLFGLLVLVLLSFASSSLAALNLGNSHQPKHLTRLSKFPPQAHTNQLHQQIQAHQLQQQQQQSLHTKRPGLLDKICIGTTNRLSLQHNQTDHYGNLYDRYKNCTYVIGNLEITWLDKGNHKHNYDLSFLESIREITGYLLIAHVKVERIRMPNLQIIRGRDLFKHNNEVDEFAMILIENELKTLELPNLREILAGSFGSFNNKNLCHLRTINWDEILNWPPYRTVLVYNSTEPECPNCHSSCLGSCWSEGHDMCQKFSKISCSDKCGQGRCFGVSDTDCCHSYCAGGCTGPKQTDCLACKNFYDDGACIQECPSMMRYNPSEFLWEPNPEGKYAFGGICVKECPQHLLRDNGACVRTCPSNKISQNGECVPCGGPCPRHCQGVEVVHSGNIDQLINCTKIEGSITITDASFTGFNETCAANTTCIQHKPMHPSRLEAFKTLREITGYLAIRASHPDFKDLRFFKNLQFIGGRQAPDMSYALVITGTSLISLNLHSLRKVKSGKILVADNRDLCFAQTIDWVQTNITRLNDAITKNNAEDTKCQELGLQCHEQCAKDGCWGPGPDECLSCNNYKFDDYCVDNCSSTLSQIGSLSYDAGGRTCKSCHIECKGGCGGPEAKHCWHCKSVRDGPYCVPECPSHKYNNNGFCEECDKNCMDGCTGPSGKLGPGGCNSCAKAVIDSTDPTFVGHCIKADKPCPDGYYQEYVGPQAEGPLKSSSGKPVCRKCHHKCKSCTGMGTHLSVCDCAKYAAGEQCEDFCPRDYFADEQHRQCVRCSPECNGCFGPTESDCITCRVYRVYYSTYNQIPAAQISPIGLIGVGDVFELPPKSQVRFNCTAQCPPDKPHRISEGNMLDPYCSENPGPDMESSRISLLGSGSLIILLLITGAVMACVLVYRCQIEKDKKVSELTMHLSGINDGEPLCPSNLKPNVSHWRNIKETELRKGKILGEGFGGKVYQGFWYPEAIGDKKQRPRPVAIKVLNDTQYEKSKNFLDEAYIMASIDHKNLVRLLAVCMTRTQLMLVTPLMPLGCLLDYVRKHKKEIGSKNLLEWCKQIAKGMAYLEERRMVHRDLALRNVLLQTPGRALVSDFGLSKFLENGQSEYQAGGGRLPIRWLAPECIRERKFTHKSDVWAFGVTIWELLTFGATKPYDEYETMQVPKAIEAGARLHQASHVTAEVYKVMYSCWFYNSMSRPDFKLLVQNFVGFARDPERYLDLSGAEGIVMPESPGTNDMGCEEYHSYTNSFDEGESQPPLSALPELTPSTNNQLNIMFGFDMRQNQKGDPDMETDNQQVHLQGCKGKLSGIHGSRQQLVDEGFFSKRSHELLPHGLTNMTTDVNNNIIPDNSCWSIHHNASTSSLGQKSEQPTDRYEYLEPSHCANEHNHFSTFYTGSTPITPTLTNTNLSLRNPPHSAGLIGVNNYEYFLSAKSNYTKEESFAHDDLDGPPQDQMRASNNDMPHSLV